MAEEREIGTTSFHGLPEDCEAEGCDQKTTEHIWDGERWQAVCDEHSAGLQDKLRRKKVLGDQ